MQWCSQLKTSICQGIFHPSWFPGGYQQFLMNSWSTAGLVSITTNISSLCELGGLRSCGRSARNYKRWGSHSQEALEALENVFHAARSEMLYHYKYNYSFAQFGPRLWLSKILTNLPIQLIISRLLSCQHLLWRRGRQSNPGQVMARFKQATVGGWLVVATELMSPDR